MGNELKKENENVERIGIAYYTIEKDGCLNGIWTEFNRHGKIFNEMAKNKNISKKDDKNIVGEYIFCWIENDKITGEGSLKIKKIGNSVYKFTWVGDIRTNCKFKECIGIGIKTDENHLAISYYYTEY
jgi:hypothetical protein